MSKMQFTPKDYELLIELVSKNPTLFDPRIDSYKDAVVREKIWKEIGVKMNRTGVDCKKRWKIVRDSYNRLKRKKEMTTRSVAPAKKTTKFGRLFERLQFLEQVVSNRASDSITSFKTDVPSPMTNEEVEIPFDSEENEDIIWTQPAARSTKTPAKKCEKVEDELTYLKKRDDQRQFSYPEFNSFRESDDEVNTFSNHVKSVMRKLNQRFQILAREEIFGILTKYELMQVDMECSIQTAPPTSDERTGSANETG